MMDFLRWLWSEPPLMMIVLGLLGICIQLARMAVQEDKKPDTSFAPGEAEKLSRAIEIEARQVEKFVNGTLRSDVRNEYLKLFWAHHDKVIQNLRRARIGDVMSSLVGVSQIEDRIADGIENGKLVDDCNGLNVPATVAGISRNYCDRVMRILGPHLRQETLKRVGEVTGRQLDPRSGRALRPEEQQRRKGQPERPSARDALRRR
ncbi:MAG: hypothetical protein ACLFV8_08295 [Alphaproteobacteria bacterium]